MRTRFLCLLCLCVLPAAAGCSDTPNDAATSFYDGISAGDVSGVLDMLSSDTREQLGDDNLRAAIQFLHSASVAQGGIKVGRATTIRMSTDGSEAWVAVQGGPRGVGDNSGAVHLVLEDGEWKVDVTSGLGLLLFPGLADQLSEPRQPTD